MELMTTHRHRTLKNLSKEEDVAYIVYNFETKKFKKFNNINKLNSKFFEASQNFQVNNEILIFIKDMCLENISDNLKIKEAINTSSFTVSDFVRDELLKLIFNHPSYNFVDKEINIIQNIQKSMKAKNTTQATKYYNNILRRLKYTRIDILEKSKEEKTEDFKIAIQIRDKRRKNKRFNAMKKSDFENFDIIL